MSKSIIVFAGAALTAALGTSPAAAENQRLMIVEKVAVAHADLDLTTRDGAQAMLARLDRAASAACGGKPTAMSTDPLAAARQREYAKCNAAALDSATMHLGAPLVRAAHVSRGEPAAYAAKDN